MAWSFVLTDLNYVPLGEILNAQNRVVSLSLNSYDTASLVVRLDNPLAPIMATVGGYLKAYRNGVLRFFGPIITAEETGDALGATVAVNCISPGWFLTKRLAGRSATGTVFSSATDRAQIIASLLATTNAENDTGIAAGAMSAASSITYTAGPYRYISDLLTELSASYDGFDWRLIPVDNYANGVLTGPTIATMIAAPSLGTTQTNAVFEWGQNGRGNIASYTRQTTRDQQANQLFHFTSDGPDAPGFGTLSTNNTDSIAIWRMTESLAEGDIKDFNLRNALLAQHLAVRKSPRQTITFNPVVDPLNANRLPEFGIDYDVADRVRARAQYNSSVRFDAYLRVWGVSFSIDNSGAETASLTLSEQ